MIRTIIFELLIFTSCYTGDKLLGYQFYHTQLVHAVVDNVTHGLVAFFCWAAFTELKTYVDLFHCLICCILAMGVDIDHFLSAKSWTLKDALSLTSRPFFHASTLILLVMTVLWTAGIFLKDNRCKVFCAIFFISWTSHHIRDATRRGIWLPPLGSTRPLPYWMYISLTMALPLLLKVISPQLNITHFQENVILGKYHMMDV